MAGRRALTPRKDAPTARARRHGHYASLDDKNTRVDHKRSANPTSRKKGLFTIAQAKPFAQMTCEKQPGPGHPTRVALFFKHLRNSCAFFPG